MTIRDGIKRIDRLHAELEDGRAIAEPYAEALAQQAKRNASRRPTPQARMVSEALTVRGATLLVPTSAVVSGRGGSPRAGEVAGGSEYGSSIYPQFGPRRGTPGAWLGAAAARPDSSTVQAGERALEDVVRRAVR